MSFNALHELARRNFKDFVRATKTDYQFNWHHIHICAKLNAFERGEIKKLMIFVPPQHGKSELATRRLPAYLLGRNPRAKIAVCSYSATLATSFNRDIQRVIDTDIYHSIFPETRLNQSNVSTSAKGSFLRNSEIFEVVNHRGFVKTVGVGGSLTGTPVDIAIVDDPIKDRADAMSPRIRDGVWSWFTDVLETRLHNESQMLLIMTRWHEDDIAGRLLRRDDDWDVLKLEAIKETDVKDDPRKLGEALWPERHSLERLELIKDNSPVTFNSLYQQNPKPSKEALVFPVWTETYDWPDYAQSIWGLDFGYVNDPTALIELAEDGDRLYWREWVYDTGIGNEMLHELLMQAPIQQGTLIVSDKKRDTVDYLKAKGWNIEETEKPKGSIENGLSMLKERKHYIWHSSRNIMDEFNKLQYYMLNGVATNLLIPGNDHAFDAGRYAYVRSKRGSAGTHVGGGNIGYFRRTIGTIKGE
jgi:hypothetical protein